MSQSRLPRFYFVLSAGRTGTLFWQRQITQQFPDVDCRHEPSPARLEHLAANFSNRYRIGRRFLRSWFKGSRTHRASKTHYIEINPMLCPLANQIDCLPGDVTLIHLIRHPLDWTHSILNFRASGMFRHFIHWIPFSTPAPSPLPENWKKLEPTAKALWRWRYCNEMIESARPYCREFVQLRYEDLLMGDSADRVKAIQKLLFALELPPPGDKSLQQVADQIAKAKRENMSPATSGGEISKQSRINTDSVNLICGDLMSRYGYEITA